MAAAKTEITVTVSFDAGSVKTALEELQKLKQCVETMGQSIDHLIDTFAYAAQVQEMQMRTAPEAEG